MIGLKIIRTKHNLTQQELAIKLGVSREAISLYESNRRDPSLDMLRKLSSFFNVSIDYLINGEEFVPKNDNNKKLLLNIFNNKK